MSDPLVLDTCAMYDRDLVFKLGKYHGGKILPAVAYMEYAHHMIMDKGKSPESISRTLKIAGIEIEQFNSVMALNTVRLAEGNIPDFKENVRDYMIAAHAFTAPRIIVTNNVDHFSYIRDRVETVQQVIRNRLRW